MSFTPWFWITAINFAKRHFFYWFSVKIWLALVLSCSEIYLLTISSEHKLIWANSSMQMRSKEFKILPHYIALACAIKTNHRKRMNFNAYLIYLLVNSSEYERIQERAVKTNITHRGRRRKKKTKKLRKTVENNKKHAKTSVSLDVKNLF